MTPVLPSWKPTKSTPTAASHRFCDNHRTPHTTLSKAHPHHSLESVMDHFTYIVDLVGIDHRAFDGSRVS